MDYTYDYKSGKIIKGPHFACELCGGSQIMPCPLCLAPDLEQGEHIIVMDDSTGKACTDHEIIEVYLYPVEGVRGGKKVEATFRAVKLRIGCRTYYQTAQGHIAKQRIAQYKEKWANHDLDGQRYKDLYDFANKEGV